MDGTYEPPDIADCINAGRWKGKGRQVDDLASPELFGSDEYCYCEICDDLVPTDGSHCVRTHIPAFCHARGFSTDQTSDASLGTMSTNTTSTSTDHDLTLSSVEDSQDLSLPSTEDIEMPDPEPERRTAHPQPLTDTGRKYCELLARTCESEGRRPDAEEIRAVNVLQKNATFEAIVEWLTLRLASSSLRDDAQDTPRPATEAAPTEPPIPCVPMDPHRVNIERRARVQAELAKYVENRNANPCENSKYRSSSPQKQYICPFGCGYSAAKGDSLCRHLQATYPQDFWYCPLCTETPIFHRHDKWQEHLSNIHKHGTSKDDICRRDAPHSGLCQQSQLDHDAPLPTTCPFANEDGPCPKTFRSWEQFREHLLKHFRGKIPYGSWSLKYWPRGPPEGDDEDGPRTSSSKYTSGHFSSNYGSSFGTTNEIMPSTQTSGHREVVPYRAQDIAIGGVPALEVSGMHKALPESLALIDVIQNALVMPLSAPRYIAMSHISDGRAVTSGSVDIGSPAMHPLEALLLVYGEAMRVTRAMGYQFLWIDAICEGQFTPDTLKERQRQATLILVVSGPPSGSDRLWHLACSYDDMNTITTWMPDIPLTLVKRLGRGSSGIVDQVTIGTPKVNLARKMLVGRSGKIAPMHEVHMLQRVDHPNITKFVAAYLEQGSISILTSPVADCNLRVFLQRPKQRQNLQNLIPKWMCSLSSAVQHLHAQMGWHQDIKPSNILIRAKEIFLSDFGSSREITVNIDDAPRISGVTPRYCAPELFNGKRYGAAADIFSLGCVFVEMATVMTNRTLTDLSRHLEQRSSSDGVIYSKSIPELKCWLNLLKLSATSADQCSILAICANMLSYHRSDRPTAANVRKLLQGDYSGLPSRHAGYFIIDGTALQTASLMQSFCKSAPEPQCRLTDTRHVHAAGQCSRNQAHSGDPHQSGARGRSVPHESSIEIQVRSRNTPTAALGMRDIGSLLFNILFSTIGGIDIDVLNHISGTISWENVVWSKNVICNFGYLILDIIVFVIFGGFDSNVGDVDSRFPGRIFDAMRSGRGR